MAVQFGPHSTSTRAARSDEVERAGSEWRGTRWIAPTRKSRAHIDGQGGGIIWGADGIDIGIDIGTHCDGRKDISTRRTGRRLRACLPMH